MPGDPTISTYGFRLPLLAAVTIPENVAARKANQTVWHALQGISIAQVEIPPEGWRAPHYHTNTNELALIIRGRFQAVLIQPPGALSLLN